MTPSTPPHPTPCHELHIYYFQDRLASPYNITSLGDAFIGNWEEGDTSFLFFREPADDVIAGLMAREPHLRLVDRFHMTYDEWHGAPVTPFRAGRFLISPPWAKPAVPDRPGDIPLLLDPGVVFGAGSHATTRDCLTALERLFDAQAMATVLDLGTGTGLLAVAAGLLGAKQVVGVDNNFLAARTARRNARLNNLSDRVNIACVLAQDVMDWPADLLAANIHHDVMRQLIGHPGFLAKKWFVLSGLLRTEAADIQNRLAEMPVKVLETWVRDGVWHTVMGKIDPRGRT